MNGLPAPENLSRAVYLAFKYDYMLYDVIWSKMEPMIYMISLSRLVQAHRSLSA